MTDRLVIIGGDAGGMTAAAQARRRRSEDDLEIVAFERGRFTSYSACGIPYWLGGEVQERDDLIARSPDEHRRRGIDVHLQTEVVGLDTEERVVTVHDLKNGTEREESYDEVVIATGAVPTLPPLDGAEGEGIFGLQTLEDGSDIARWLSEQDPRRAVVVGGGYVGLEMAEALVMRGLDVSLVEMGPQPMNVLDPDMGQLVAEAAREAGIHLHLGKEAVAFELADGRIRAVATDDGELPADIVVLGLGVEPDTAVAADAGLDIGTSGGVVVDRRCQTSADGVWAAGDCTEKFHLVSRSPVTVPLGTHANKQGRVVGINVGGGYATFPGIVGTAASRICDVEVAHTGLTESDASAAGFEHVSARVRSTTRAGYYPGASPLTVKVVAEKRSGRLLGAQIVGREGAGKRIDTFATALWNGMLIDDLLNVDLSYAPPIAPLWDPVLIAARKTWQAVEEALPSS